MLTLVAFRSTLMKCITCANPQRNRHKLRYLLQFSPKWRLAPNRRPVEIDVKSTTTRHHLDLLALNLLRSRLAGLKPTHNEDVSLIILRWRLFTP